MTSPLAEGWGKRRNVSLCPGVSMASLVQSLEKILSLRMSLMLLRILYLEGCNCTLPNDFVFSDKAIQSVLNMKILIYCQFWPPPFVN